jgi:hypothetical protein
MPVWQRVQKDGAIVYSPDPAHPVFADFSARLPVELQADFASLIGLIGSTIPIPALHADFAGCPEEITIDAADVEAVRQMSEAMVPRLLSQGTDRERIPDILRQVEPFHSAWTIAKPLIDTIIERETGIV